MSEQEKQKLKDALIEDRHIHSTEYDDEDAFVGICFSDLVDIINSVMHNTGWHQASECPKVGEDGDVEVIVIQDNYNVDKAIYCEIEGIRMWDLPNIKWWCYPPKED